MKYGIQVAALALVSVFALACQAAGPPEGVECLNAEDVSTISDQYVASMSGARDTHFLDRVCVEAELTSMERGTTTVNIRGDVGEAWMLVLHVKTAGQREARDEEDAKMLQESDRKAKELEAWMEDKELGETFWAMCTITGFEDPGTSYRSRGTPEFSDCELVEG